MTVSVTKPSPNGPHAAAMVTSPNAREGRARPPFRSWSVWTRPLWLGAGNRLTTARRTTSEQHCRPLPLDRRDVAALEPGRRRGDSRHRSRTTNSTKGSPDEEDTHARRAGRRPVAEPRPRRLQRRRRRLGRGRDDRRERWLRRQHPDGVGLGPGVQHLRPPGGREGLPGGPPGLQARHRRDAVGRPADQADHAGPVGRDRPAARHLPHAEQRVPEERHQLPGHLRQLRRTPRSTTASSPSPSWRTRRSTTPTTACRSTTGPRSARTGRTSSSRPATRSTTSPTSRGTSSSRSARTCWPRRASRCSRARPARRTPS